MNKNNILILIILIAVVMGAIFFFGKSNSPKIENVGMANPASVFCKENGGQSQMQKDEKGEYANCIFPNGQKCEEWTLFRGECAIDGVVNLAKYSDDKNQVSAAFFVKENTAILNAKHLNFENLFMNIAESASGARYLSQDGKVEFWEHQGETTISVGGKKMFVGKIATTKVGCNANGKIYKEGDIVNQIEGQGVLADANYVCKNGSWVVVGDGSEGMKLPPQNI
jgi:putative hemolysin